MRERSQTEIRHFMHETNHELQGLYTNMMDSLWHVITTGEIGYLHENERFEQAYQEALASPDLGRKMEAGLAGMEDDRILRRQFQMLRGEMLEYQAKPEERREITSLWNELHYMHSTFRARVDGALMSGNTVLVLLRRLKDERQRKKIWQASMEVGGQAAPKLIRLVKLRNQIARDHGYPHYFAMKLETQGISPDMLRGVIRQLRSGLEAVYRKVKGEMDEETAARFRIHRSELRSWHYAHPFVQTAQKREQPGQVDINGLLPQLARWFDERGLDIKPLLGRADLTGRPGKGQANCCLNIDRGGDIRMSCNLTQDTEGLPILLHELGHAIFEQGIDPELPFVLRQPAHPFVSEGVALLLERLASEPAWQQQLQLGRSKARRRTRRNPQLRRELLIKLYWTLTVIEFERELYTDPSRPLNRLWWDIVEDVQGIQRPDDWDYPYWAAKSHLSTLPVYYYNYLLGEVAASQFQFSLQKEFGQWHSREALQHLNRQVFKPGASCTWNEIIASCTSCDLNPVFLIQQLRN
ncbi:M2 family metallopeptidase [Paenibacillus lutrae]|uniref:Peptidase M3 n=1 Tax=Paenibacillus lutrae TaxID=2078573 RepID=A0A7X3FFT4_9BACL|nr:M2 family metallopeptidase [Paenibacillus lutrae]MVO98825.1 peptidase M3 [Paenibacillus lutrae]